MPLKLSSIYSMVETQFDMAKSEKLKQLLTNRTLFVELFNIAAEEYAKETGCLRKIVFATTESGKNVYELPEDTSANCIVHDIISVLFNYSQIYPLYNTEIIELDNDVADSTVVKADPTWTEILGIT